jgi:hypothetical protein
MGNHNTAKRKTQTNCKKKKKIPKDLVRETKKNLKF